MRATATPTDPTHVKLLIELEDPDVKEAIDATITRLGREMTVKGFRKGKVPRQVIEARLGGASALRGEALSNSLSSFYARAVSETGVDPISRPEIEVESGEDEGDFVFSATVEVRPDLPISGQRGLRVTIPSPIVSDDEVEHQIRRVLETDAVLSEVDRPIMNGDVLTIDVTSTKLADSPTEEPAVPTELEDLSYTVGSGALAQGVDEMLIGLRAGEKLEAAASREGALYRYDISIKKVSEQVLPELTDEWVAENTSHESVEALREEILTQLRRRRIIEAKFAQRDAALMALSELVSEDDIPGELEQLELEYRMNEFSERLDRQGLEYDVYLQVTNQTTDDLVAALRADAKRAVRVDLALRALASAEGLEPDDDAINEELEKTAESMRVPVGELRQNLHDNGRTPSFYWEIAKLNASKWLLSNVTYVDETGAEIDRTLLEETEPAESEGVGSDEGAGA